MAIANDHQDVYSAKVDYVEKGERFTPDSRRTEAEHLNDSRQNS